MRSVAKWPCRPARRTLRRSRSTDGNSKIASGECGETSSLGIDRYQRAGRGHRSREPTADRVCLRLLRRSDRHCGHAGAVQDHRCGEDLCHGRRRKPRRLENRPPHRTKGCSPVSRNGCTGDRHRQCPKRLRGCSGRRSRAVRGRRRSLGLRDECRANLLVRIVRRDRVAARRRGRNRRHPPEFGSAALRATAGRRLMNRWRRDRHVALVAPAHKKDGSHEDE